AKGGECPADRLDIEQAQAEQQPREDEQILSPLPRAQGDQKVEREGVIRYLAQHHCGGRTAARHLPRIVLADRPRRDPEVVRRRPPPRTSGTGSIPCRTGDAPASA